MIINSITRSERIIARNSYQNVTGNFEIPEIKGLVHKTFEEVNNLKINKVLSSGTSTLSFVLSDGE
jgi:hypothetical protein